MRKSQTPSKTISMTSSPPNRAIAPPATLVLLVAPPGPLGGVRDILQDWSALGLVSPFIWIGRLDKPTTGRTPAVWIDAGESALVTLDQVLSKRRYDRIRVCVLVPALRGVAPVTEAFEDHVAQLAADASGSRVDQIRCTIVRPRSGPGAGTIARPQWHNLVVSPEDNQGPNWGRQVLDPSLDAVDIGPHAAAVVCGVSGLWSSITKSPFDDEVPYSGQTVRVARSFFRQLEAVDVERRVRRGMMSMVDGFPKPSQNAARSSYAKDVDAAVNSTAHALWNLHEDVLSSGELKPAAPEVQRIGPMEAIMMFLRFFGSTIIHGPSRWWNAVKNELAGALAAGVQRSVFTDQPVDYEVVVRGVGANDEPADWREVADATGRLGEIMTSRSGLRPLPGRTPLPTLWRDFIGAALTLADGGDHVQAIRYLRQGSERVVLRHPADVAPGVEAAFSEAPADVKAAAGGMELRPTDVLAVDAARRRLKAHGEPSGIDGESTRRSLAQLGAWWDRHARSFTVRVGDRLGKAVTSNANDVRELLAALENATLEPERFSDLERRQRTLTIIMWILLALIVVSVGLITYLGINDLITTTRAVLSGIGAVAGWFLLTGVAFAIQQRNLFAALNRRRQATAQAIVDRQNLEVRMQDLRRTSQAYGEFLEWSRIVGVLVNRPFGDRPDEDAPRVMVGDGMPACASIGVARPNDVVVEEAVQWLRHDRYRFGWLGRAWESLLADAPNRLGPKARELRSDPDKMYAEPSGPDDLLSRWAEILDSEGVGGAAADWLWQEALEALKSSPLADSLIADVATAGGGYQPLTEFLADIGCDDVDSRTFDTEVFSIRAQIAGRHAVHSTWTADAERPGLGRAAVMVQLSAGLPLWDLAWGTEKDQETDNDDDRDFPEPF
jgi:hypothetical protein